MNHESTWYIHVLLGRSQDLVGGGARFFRDVLGGLGLCCPEKILKNGAIWCVLTYIFIRFCLKNLSKISIFNAKNNNSSYTVVMGYVAPGEIFKNMLQLMNIWHMYFSVYFEIYLNTINGYFYIETMMSAVHITLECFEVCSQRKYFKK